MITEDYVSFETTKLLRERGFEAETYASIRVFAGHNCEVNGERITPEKDTIIPTLQMAMKWLREEYKIHIQIWILEAKHGFIAEILPDIAVAESLRIADCFLKHWYGDTEIDKIENKL